MPGTVHPTGARERGAVSQNRRVPFTPYDAGVDTLTRARELLAAAASADLPAQVADDLRRLALVMAVASIDAYMHRLIVSRAYEQEKLPGKLAGLGVSFSEALAQADESVAARRKGKDIRPRVRLKRVLRDRLLRETFQRSSDVADALAMAGKSGKWQDIADAMAGSWEPKTLKDRLDGVVDRRNAIVHEGDYERLDRPQTARLVPIDHADASAAVEFVAEPVDAIHTVISR